MLDVDITVSTTECTYHGDRTFVTVDRQQANQLQLWCQIRQNALQTVTGSISRAKPSPSPFGKPTDLPDASPLRTLEHSLTQMLEMVRRLHGHRTK
jgi:hypothetical protein